MSQPPSKIIPLKREFEDSRPLYALTIGEFRQLLRDERARESKAETVADADLIDANAAAKEFGVTKGWLYHNSTLPFVHKLGPRTTRYSRAGMREWRIEKKKR